MPTDRRGFLTGLLSWLGLAAPAALVGFDVLQFLSPSAGAQGTRKVFVARLEALRPGEVRPMADLRGKPMVVLRPAEGPPRALSMVCTHLGCRVRWEAAKERFLCPCHLGWFDQQGNVLSGPPPRPLARYEVTVEDGNVYVQLPEA